MRPRRFRSLLTSLLPALILISGCGRSPAGPEPLPVRHDVVDFALTERSGAAVRKADLLGRVWLADFIFTRCSGPCPTMTRRMGEIQDRLPASEDFRLVTVSVDPAHDTPEVLRAHALAAGADPRRWLFLTGAEEEIRRLLRDGMKLMSGEDLLNHSVKFVLVDRRGRVRGWYVGEGEDAASAGDIVADMVRVAAEPGP